MARDPFVDLSTARPYIVYADDMGTPVLCEQARDPKVSAVVADTMDALSPYRHLRSHTCRMLPEFVTGSNWAKRPFALPGTSSLRANGFP